MGGISNSEALLYIPLLCNILTYRVSQVLLRIVRHRRVISSHISSNMADSTYGGGAAAAPSGEASAPCKDARDTLYTFDEAKLDLIRKTKPWMQE